MKKFLCVILAALTLAMCAACGSQPASGSDKAANRLEEIKQRGYIEVCTEPYFAPFEFIDSTKSGSEQYVGVDMEIAKYIADKLGVELRIVPLEFSAVLAGISESKYDLAISALAYSPARAEVMNMSDGYYTDSSIGYGLLVRAEDAGKYTDLASLADAVVVTQSGSVQEAIMNEQVQCKETKLVSSMTDGFLMVQEGKADVCVCETGNGQLYADANGGLAVPAFRFTVDSTLNATCVGIPLGEQELTDFVNTCISELNAAGSVSGWYSQYSELSASLGVD